LQSCDTNHQPLLLLLPRWDADEMTARLFNFVKQQAPSILKDMEGGSGGAAL
jgi:hypothetical protein